MFVFRVKRAALLFLIVLVVGVAGFGAVRLQSGSQGAEPGDPLDVRPRPKAVRPPTDQEAIQGMWKIVTLLEEGKEPDARSTPVVDMTFREGTLREYLRSKGEKEGETVFYRYRLDPTAHPKRIDLVRWEKDFDDPDEVQRGVYTLEGNVLRLCIAGVRAERPTHVESEENSGTALIVLRKGEPARDHGSEASAAFRRLEARYAASFAEPPNDRVKMQRKWLDDLAGFVRTYPRAAETPNALLQLGLTNEFQNDEGFARAWYERLNRDFPETPEAAKARGALRRLSLVGKRFQLTAPRLEGGDCFEFEQLHGKLVIVYYWASWNRQARDDFAQLQRLVELFAPRELALVLVNLDNTPEEAREFLRRYHISGVHLVQPARGAHGLEGPLIAQYGIMMLPTLFVVGKDGKVLSRTAQIRELEAAVDRWLK